MELRHCPSFLRDVVLLHEPGAGTTCFVEALEETTAYRNDFYLSLELVVEKVATLHIPAISSMKVENGVYFLP